MNTITSRFNNEIKKVALLKTARHRNKEKQFIAEGYRTISTLIQSGLHPIQLYLTENVLDNVPTGVNEKNCTLVTDHVMEKISCSTTPSGLLAVFNLPKSPDIKNVTAGIVLSDISDPGNMGTLIRSAAAMNVKTVVVIDGAHPWSPKVVQASVGTIGMVNIFRCTRKELLENKKSLQLCALVVAGGDNLNSLDAKNSLLVVGSEAHGIDTKLLKACEQKVTLPMPGNTESLNAAVAGSIALYLAHN